MDDEERMFAVVRKGAALGESLVGLPVEQAVAVVEEQGFDPVRLDHDVTILTADLRPHRIRLFVDPRGTVVRTSAG